MLIDEQRRRVWQAMSVPFLDTETRQELPFSALDMLDSKFSRLELRRIWVDEVAPHCFSNFMGVVRAVDGIDFSDKAMLRRDKLTRWLPWTHVYHHVLAAMVQTYWRTLTDLMDVLEKVPAALRRDRARFFYRVACLYFVNSPNGAAPVGPPVDGNLDAMLTCFEHELRPIYKRALAPDELQHEPERAARARHSLALDLRP